MALGHGVEPDGDVRDLFVSLPARGVHQLEVVHEDHVVPPGQRRRLDVADAHAAGGDQVQLQLVQDGRRGGQGGEVLLPELPALDLFEAHPGLPGDEPPEELAVSGLQAEKAHPAGLRHGPGHLEGQQGLAAGGVAADDHKVPGLHLQALVQPPDAPGEIDGLLLQAGDKLHRRLAHGDLPEILPAAHGGVDLVHHVPDVLGLLVFGDRQGPGQLRHPAQAVAGLELVQQAGKLPALRRRQRLGPDGVHHGPGVVPGLQHHRHGRDGPAVQKEGPQGGKDVAAVGLGKVLRPQDGDRLADPVGDGEQGAQHPKLQLLLDGHLLSHCSSPPGPRPSPSSSRG